MRSGELSCSALPAAANKRIFTKRQKNDIAAGSELIADETSLTCYKCVNNINTPVGKTQLTHCHFKLTWCEGEL